MSDLSTVDYATVEGLPTEQMDRLMNELLPGSPEAGGALGEEKDAAAGWDKMTLLTGGFVPVGSIFWARPPKLFSQQKIMLAIDAAEQAGQNESMVKGLVEQSNILCALACELFYVQDSGNFRPATEQEIGGDAVGLDAAEIKDAFFRLIGVDTKAEAAEGNA